MGAPYVLLLVLRNSDVEWCIAVEVIKQESFCKVHLRILCIFFYVEVDVDWNVYMNAE